MPQYGTTTNFLINYAVSITVSSTHGGNEADEGFSHIRRAYQPTLALVHLPVS